MIKDKLTFSKNKIKNCSLFFTFKTRNEKKIDIKNLEMTDSFIEGIP